MSQATASAPVTAPAVPIGLPAPVPGSAVDPMAKPRRGRVREAARSGLNGTPGRMRIAAAAAVLASLVFGLLGGSAFRGWGGALDSAEAEAAQLVRIQTIQNDLVKADAAAANAYLRGGSEDPATRAIYDAAISDAARRLAQPAATAADSTILETAVDGLSRYTGLVEQARANNRQGMQVGAAYQRVAGEVLRNEIVPALRNRVRPPTSSGWLPATTGPTSTRRCWWWPAPSRCWCCCSSNSGWRCEPTASSTCRWPARRWPCWRR